MFENFKKFSFNFNFYKIFPYNLSCFQHILIDFSETSESISFTKFYRQKLKLQRNISTLSKSSVSRRDKHFHTRFDIFSNFCKNCHNKSCVNLQILVEYHLFTLYTRKLCEKLMI